MNNSIILKDNYNKNIDNAHKIKIINLKCRVDRKKAMVKKLKENNIQQYDFIEAVDGMQLNPTKELNDLFKGNDFDSRRGFIGCALTHYNLFLSLLQDTHNDYYIIMEDDIIFCKDFDKKIIKLTEERIFNKIDLSLLGYSMYEKQRNKYKDIYDNSGSILNIQPYNKQLYIGGFFCYSINKLGAYKMVEYIKKNGIKHGIDYLIKIIPGLKIAELQPQMAFTKWQETTVAIDTDIQNNYLQLIYKRLDNEFIFIQGLDQCDCDVDFHSNSSLTEKFEKAYYNNNCIGFNTLGYFKNKIDNLTASKYFGNTDGIYVKKEYHEKYQLQQKKKQNQTIDLNNEYNNEYNNESVYICGCVKNNEKYLKNVFENIKKIIKLFKKYEIIIAYDHSDDESYNILKNYSKQLNIKILNNNNNSNFTVINICNARNSILDYIRSKSIQSRYMIMMDMDDVCSKNLNVNILKKYIFKENNWDCLTFNREGYYDIWALSIDDYLLSCQHWNNFDKVVHIMKNHIINKLHLSNILVDCKSAFNGFGIYKLEKFINCIYKAKIEDTLQFIKNVDIKKNEEKLEMKFNKFCTKVDCEHRYFHFDAINKNAAKIKISPEILFSNPKYCKKTRIKLLCNWCSSEQLCKEWSVMCEEGLHWKDIEITSEDENIDYYVIINRPPPDAYYIPEKTIIFQMEPWIYNATKDWGVHTWGEWSIPDEKKFLYVGRHKNSLNNVQWQITIPPVIPEATYRLDKAFTCLSEKNFDFGHKKRIEFLKKLEERKQGRTDLIDIYGRGNYHSLSHYKGPLKGDKKENHFIDYKYCFAVENNSEHNYATEKIWEPILCECLCFYWGCPNLKDYINSKAFVRLDLNDMDKSIKIIETAIKEDWWSQRIEIIKKEKDKLLNKLGFFPNLLSIINTNEEKNNLKGNIIL